MLRRWLAGFCIVLFSGATASGQEASSFAYSDNDTAMPSFISEIRAGIYAHKVTYDFIPVNANRWIGLNQIEDVQFEILFSSPDMDFFRWMGSPRPNLGGTFNIKGVESLVHLGLTWQLPIFNTPVFIEGTFGVAVTNGALNGVVSPLSNFGCPIGFYEAAGIGINLNENVSVMIGYEHTSNLDFCSPNDGLSNLGIKVGYKF